MTCSQAEEERAKANHSVTLQRLSRLNENPFSLNSDHHQNSGMDGLEARHECANGFRDLIRSDSNGRARCVSPNRPQSSGNRIWPIDADAMGPMPGYCWELPARLLRAPCARGQTVIAWFRQGSEEPREKNVIAKI